MPDKPWDEDRALVADESRDAVWALRMVEEQLAAVESEPWRWKWVIIATHNALQCAMVLALHDWHGLEILREDHRKKMAAWLNGEREEYPKAHLDHFRNLYGKIKGEAIGGRSGQKAFEATEDHDQAARLLNGHRNEFVHFTPQSWIMTRHELAVVTHRWLDIMRFLVFDSGAIQIHDRELAREIEERTSQALDRARALEEQLAASNDE